MASGCTITSKACLFVLGLIFWGAAAGLFFVGGWVFKTYKHFDELSDANFTLIPASIMLAVGIFMFVIGILAFVVVCKNNRLLLACLFSLLLIVLTAEVGAGALGYAFKKDVANTVETGLHKAVTEYDSGVVKDQMDYLQNELKCCGYHNASDWFNPETAWGKNHSYVPESCCKVDTNCSISARSRSTLDESEVYITGCFHKLEDLLQMNLAYVAGIAIAFAVIQVFGMICSCVLFCRSKEVKYEPLGGQYSGLRV